MKRHVAAYAVCLCLMAGAARAEGMPQLDFASPLLTAQVIWGSIIFAAFYIGAARWGLPKVAAVLATREHTIASNLEAARLSKERADRAIAELNEARRAAYAEAQAALAAATQRAKEAAAVKSAEVAARLDRQLADAEKNIAAARAGAMATLREAASETAEMLITRVAGHAADPQTLRDAIGTALAARGLASA
jgi:F-type H+-transporting ATPase subunit b